MSDKGLRQDKVRNARKEQQQTVERYRPGGIIILVEPSGRKRHKRKPEQQVQVGPKDWSGNPLGSVQKMVMIVPVDADVDKAQDVAQEDGSRGPERLQRRAGRNLEVQNHDRDNDCEYAVAESFKTPFVHRGGFWITLGCFQPSVGQWSRDSQSLGTFPAGPGAGCSSGCHRGSASLSPLIILRVR